ncbi:MAG: hypothetical protein ACW99Q_00785 [Candidatus Kariarchaeaceae archaeon]
MATQYPLYFATSGIRGKANTEISPELAIEIGKNMVGWIKRNNPDLNKYLVCIGYDNRRNSKFLAYCAGAAITSRGIDVKICISPVPTPFLIFSTIWNNAQAGLMVTGSHLPETDNGLILIDEVGNYFKGTLKEEVEDLVPWADLGKLLYFDDEERNYLALFSLYIGQVMLEPSNLKILIDPAHGVMRKYLYLVLDPMVKDIIRINWQEDDTFPGRISEPAPGNLVRSRELVIENECDIGICTDMDGDRVIFITKSGELISGDYIGALFAREIWQKDPNKIVVAPINSSAIISYIAEEHGGQLKYCRVGPPSIIRAIREWDATFAFEESGKYIFVETAIWPDSVLSVIKLLSIIQKSEKTLDELMSELPIFHSIKTKLPFGRKHKTKFDNELHKLIKETIPDVKDINDLDGFRIGFADNSWLHIRLSGTEDYVRVFSEHISKEEAKVLNELGHQIVNKLKEML